MLSYTFLDGESPGREQNKLCNGLVSSRHGKRGTLQAHEITCKESAERTLLLTI